MRGWGTGFGAEEKHAVPRERRKERERPLARPSPVTELPLQFGSELGGRTAPVRQREGTRADVIERNA
jgi:hypothetical protein